MFVLGSWCTKLTGVSKTAWLWCCVLLGSIEILSKVFAERMREALSGEFFSLLAIQRNSRDFFSSLLLKGYLAIMVLASLFAFFFEVVCGGRSRPRSRHCVLSHIGRERYILSGEDTENEAGDGG